MFEYEKRTYQKVTCYRFTDYELEDLPDELLFDPERLNEWRDWHRTREDMYKDVLLKACKCGCIGIWNGKSSLHYYLHNSTRYDGLQLTCWDDRGPVGHVDVTSAEKLAREVNWNSFTVYDMAA